MRHVGASALAERHGRHVLPANRQSRRPDSNWGLLHYEGFRTPCVVRCGARSLCCAAGSRAGCLTASGGTRQPGVSLVCPARPGAIAVDPERDEFRTLLPTPGMRVISDGMGEA